MAAIRRKRLRLDRAQISIPFRMVGVGGLQTILQTAANQNALPTRVIQKAIVL